MKSFKKFITETLSKQQRKIVDRMKYGQQKIHDENPEISKNLPEDEYENVDDHTIRIPLDPIDKIRENHVRSLLEPHGFTIHDYLGKKITDKYGRDTTIGKALSKVGEDPNLYASDERVRQGTFNSDQEEKDFHQNHEIVLSNHKYHVGGMSSGRKWTSCMTLPGDEHKNSGGSYYSKVGNDLNSGTMVAYLTPKDAIKPSTELDKHDALSRVLLKPFNSSDHEKILRPESRSYADPKNSGSGNVSGVYPTFEKTVKNFAEKVWKENPEKLYIKNPELYNDDGESYTKNPNTWKSHHLDQYARHLNNLERQYEYDPVKNPVNIHDERISIANHPNTSSETLDDLMPTDDDRTYGWAPGNHSNSPRDLVSAIIDHPNVSNETLHRIAEWHPDHMDEAYERMLDHKALSNYDLNEIAKANPNISAKHIVNHPSANDDTIHELLNNHLSQNDLEEISKHPANDEYTDEKMVDYMKRDSNRFGYDEDHYEKTLKNIINRTDSEETLHHIYKNFPDYRIVHSIINHPNVSRNTLIDISSNPNVESSTKFRAIDKLNQTVNNKPITESLESKPYFLDHKADYLNDLEKSYDENTPEHPIDIHSQRLAIAKNPNTTDKTLRKLIPKFGNIMSYHFQPGSKGHSYIELSNLLNTIINHKNCSEDTFDEIQRKHPASI